MTPLRTSEYTSRKSVAERGDGGPPMGPPDRTGRDADVVWSSRWRGVKSTAMRVCYLSRTTFCHTLPLLTCPPRSLLIVRVIQRAGRLAQPPQLPQRQPPAQRPQPAQLARRAQPAQRARPAQLAERLPAQQLPQPGQLRRPSTCTSR